MFLILDGKPALRKLESQLAAEVAALQRKTGKSPKSL